MRIGFDGKRVTSNFTGLGNYGRYILNILLKNFPNHSYNVYSPKQPDELLKRSFVNSKNLFFYSPSKSFASFWRTFGIVKDLKKNNIDLYHGLSNEIPIGIHKTNIRSVVTVHDLIFIRYPHYYKFIDQLIYKIKIKYLVKHADRIIAISEQTKRDLISFFGISERRIDVVYQGCDSVYQIRCNGDLNKSIRSKYNLPDKYLLNVGTVEPRKNLLLIAKALKLIPEDIHLVVIGKHKAYKQTVQQYLILNGLEGRVQFHENVPIEDLPSIYQQAKIFLYPSEFEGFGIPIVEALCSEVPVIAATGSCLEEAGGEGSYYVNPKDEVQLGHYINLILQHPEKGKTMIENGIKHIQKFLDQKIANDLMNVYQKTINFT